MPGSLKEDESCVSHARRHAQASSQGQAPFVQSDPRSQPVILCLSKAAPGLDPHASPGALCGLDCVRLALLYSLPSGWFASTAEHG